MAKIHKLSAELSNRIAAGEVVERPSAVVKELVENAIDAKARFIDVSFVEGGISKIEVIDDGEGMDEEDALLAFERHATSKIIDEDDLFEPQHLGFRGEAIPSIASVSKCTLHTQSKTSGRSVYVEYGKKIKDIPYAGPQGTKIIVENLFRNTPARLKHLKSPYYEASIIVSLMEKFALANPEIAFRLKDEDKILLNTSGSNNLKEVYTQVYGSKIGQFTHEFKFNDYDFDVKGVWVESHINKANPYDILIYINGRILRNFRLAKAVTESYQSFLPHHRYPLACLHIRMDAKLVDVNVHPSKWEVRLSKEQQLYYLIVDKLSALLHGFNQIKPSRVQDESLIEYTEQKPLFDVSHMPTKEVRVEGVELKDNLVQEHFEVQEEAVEYQKFPTLDLIGQMHGRYILASSDEDLYWIDQHAAKERVNYELILKDLKDTSHQFELLIPENIEVKISFMKTFDDFKEIMDSIAVECERFSMNSFVVRAVPVWMQNLDIQALVLDLVEKFELNEKISQEIIRDSVIATMACHRSIRFNQALTQEDMLQIIDELSKCEQPFNCPHGRPTLIKVSVKSMWKDFER